MDAEQVRKIKIIYNVYLALDMYCKLYPIRRNAVRRDAIRRNAVRQINRPRDVEGFYACSFTIAYEKDPEAFFGMTRMTANVFDILLKKVAHKLRRKSIRTPLSPRFKLAVTLVYLAQGCSRKFIASSFKIGETTARKVILETCQSLWDILSESYLKPPNENEWCAIADTFSDIWQLPNCTGAIGGRHISISCPAGNGSLNYNYRDCDSIIMLAICDADYCFTALDIGAYDSESDGDIFAKSLLGKRIIDGKLPPPKIKKLPNTETNFPFYFIGDAAFPLRKNLMRPFPGRALNPRRENFNKRLSKAKGIIDNSFGILATRWRILTTTIMSKIETTEKIIMATVVLHNFLMQHKSEYFSQTLVDHYNDDNELVEGTWRQTSSYLRAAGASSFSNATAEAFDLRNILLDYVNDEDTF